MIPKAEYELFQIIQHIYLKGKNELALYFTCKIKYEDCQGETRLAIDKTIMSVQGETTQ